MVDQASSLRKIVGQESSQMKKKMSGAEKGGTPRVIAVTSGKGGVGKTNIVGNLAVGFARLGQKVLIIDADLGLANIDIIFGLRPKYNISHVISGERSLSEVIVETSHGIGIVPGGSGFANLTALSEGEKLNLLSEFEAYNADVDIVLIDTGAGVSSNVIYFNLAADECILVASYEPTSITDAYAMMKVMSTEHGTKHFKLLVNMVKDSSEAKAVYASLSQAADRFLGGVVIEYVGYIPRDENLRQAVINRGTVMDLFPESPASRMFRQVAGGIHASPRRFESEGNIKFFLKRFMALDGRG